MSSNKSDRANALYESDFYGWTELQAKALATRQVEALDWQNLREEIISLGKQEYRELVSRLTVLVGHLLALRDTDLPIRTFPSHCLFTFEDIITDHFLCDTSQDWP